VQPEARTAEIAVRSRLEGAASRPQVALVLGSGLTALIRAVQRPVAIPFADIPGFPPTGVAGHPGELIAGILADVPVILQSGRFHLYEGHRPELVALPIRLFRALGARILILTNAAGGLRWGFAPGTLMLIADHLNLTFQNPLHGAVRSDDARFPDMSDPYDRRLRAVAREVARAEGIALEEGVYAGLLGPSYETPSEIRMLARFGADAVGMSTVTEVIAARACGLRCLGFSVITNLTAGRAGSPLTHQEVLETASRAGTDLARLVEGIVGVVESKE
jgi:purine-nucleoside phosphorylase